jgi:tRNA-splicing ligase RtcB
MPDGHEGYGFPIGGVAAMDYDEGVISPGGVGYDINCLAGDTQILSREGFRRPISEFASCWKGSNLRVFDLNDHVGTSATITRYLALKPKDRVRRLRTENGREIVATGDHPILTSTGMKLAREISPGERVIVYPFEGIAYDPPKRRVLLGPGGFDQHRSKELRARGLMPLRLDDPRIGAIARLLGYSMGDGHFSRWNEKRRGRRKARQRLCFALSGEPAGLEEARRDIQLLGYGPSRVYSRSRRQSVRTWYRRYETVGHEHVIHVLARSFSSMMISLGVPPTKKTTADFDVPKWIRLAPLWIKRNFLAGFFGAELTKPSIVPQHAYNLQQLTLTVSKATKHRKSGVRFLQQIRRLLREFGVESYFTKPIPLTRSTIGLRLVIRSQEDNLVRLWSQIGYEYNRERQRLSSLAVEYLRMKVAHRSELMDRSKAPAFPIFEEYVRATEAKLGRSGMAYDTLLVNEVMESYSGPVYDFTVNHKDHNFVANGLVVSNCGVRLIRTNLNESDVRPALAKLLDALFNNIPSGLGSLGKIRVTQGELDKVVDDGVEWAVDHGYGWSEDKNHCEENGCMESADPSKVSSTAKSRGHRQLGSLGSGNHFLEIEKVDKIFDEHVAKHLGIERAGQILVLVHTGSRGYGHQVCSDYLRVMERAVSRYHISLPDRQLACAPSKSPEAEDYLPAMAAACNFAWVNRQMITHWTREALEKTFGKTADQLDMHLIYDVCHNVAKIEDHVVNKEGHQRKVIVHRKGATRAFPPGHSDIPAEYREIGQPVLIPGSMGTSSWLLVGTVKSMELSFGSTAHGAGRMMSRAAAKRRWGPQEIKKGLADKDIMIRAAEMGTVTEEAPGAYKDVDRVAEVSHQVGIATKVCRLVPIGVTKG